MRQVQIKYLFILLGLVFSRCNSEQNSPNGFIDFQNKKINLNSNYKYSYIDIYWEDFNASKNNKRININSNDITFSELRIVDSINFNNVLQKAKLVQIDAGTTQLGTILSVHFLVDTLKFNKIDFKGIRE